MDDKLHVIIVERKYKHRPFETKVYGPFKNLFSAKQFYEVEVEPFLDCAVNLQYTTLQTPVLFDMSQKHWMAQFS